MEEKGMNVEDTWRSFLTTVSLGINFGLLEFIKEINETRASMANERNLQRQYEILGRFGTSAEGVINAPDEEKKARAGMFMAAIERTMADGSGFPDNIKETVARAMDRCVNAGRNYESEKSFEDAVDSSDIPEEEKMEYKASYRNAMEEANAERQPFYVFQVDIDDSRAPVITASVERQLREQGYPAVGFYHEWNEGKCFIHVFDPDTAARTKALLEYELCRRSIDNIRSEESLQALASITGQNTVTYEGLSQAAAGKMYELASGKHFPVYISENKEGSYQVMFLSEGRKYAEKLLAESIVQTSGYSHKAGLDRASEVRQSERERVREYLGKVWAEDKNSVRTNLGYIVDANPKHEGNRIVFGKDSVTHITKDGNVTKITRSGNPLAFEDRVRNLVDNFSKDFVLIPADEAARLHLYNETFQITAEAREYMDGITGNNSNMDKKLYRDALLEQRFFSWAVKTSPAENAYGIFRDIQVHLDEKIQEYRKAELGNITKQFQSALKDAGSRETAEKSIEQRKESFNRDFERFFVKGNAELKVNLGRFMDQVRDNVREQEPEQRLKPAEVTQSQINSISQEKKDLIREAIRYIDEPISSDAFVKKPKTVVHDQKEMGPKDIHMQKEPIRTQAARVNREESSNTRGMDKQAGIVHDAHTSHEKGASDNNGRSLRYYLSMQASIKAEMAQRSHKPLNDPYIVECSKSYVYVQNAMDTILGNSAFYFKESRELADSARSYVYVSSNRTDGITNIPREEYENRKDELIRVMMDKEMEKVKQMFSQMPQHGRTEAAEYTDAEPSNRLDDRGNILLEEKLLSSGLENREEFENDEH